MSYSALTSQSVALAGFRYQNRWVALETAVSDAVFDNGISSIFNGNDILYHVGLFVKF